MKYFYKIENGISKTGSTSINTIPEGYVEYDPENPPKELQDLYDANDLVEEKNKLATDAKQYLSDTDWYYARKLEEGIEVPADVVAKRIELRALINSLQG